MRSFSGYTKSLFCFWNAIEKLPTFERLRSKEDDNGDQKDDDDDDKEAKKRVVDDVTKLGAQERHCFIEKLIKHIESDNLRLLRKIRNRIDKVGVKLPTVEVRYKYLRVEAECEVVHGKPRPTLWNSFKRLISGLTKISGLRLGKAKISLFKDVSGVIMSGRLTLLLGPPGCGKTTLLKVLSVNLDSSLKLTGKVSYNGYKLEEFLPEKTAAYVSQFDKLIPEMTVRETLEFSARCQGVGSRAEIMKEISRKENEAGIVPDPDIDTFMKVSASLVTVHLIDKLAAGDTGSLSVSILQKMSTMSKKLRSHPAFAKLLAQYSQSGYSEGKELNNLILSDLYYHLEGELEGRKISTRPFKELSEYLVDSKVMHNYQNKYDNDFLVTCKDVYMFDPERVRADFGSDLWDYLKWKTSKEITKRMLSQMMEANSMVLLRNSKLAALKSLITVLTIYEKDEKNVTLGGISNELVLTCMDHICKCFRATVESLAPYRGSGSEDTFHFLSAQSELLLHLLRSARKSLNLSGCIHLLKTSGSGLRVLCDFRPSTTEVNITIKLLLVLLLSTVEFCCLSSRFGGMIDMESVEDVANISNVCLGLLPILCNCTVIADHWTLSLTTVDLILRNFLTPNSWLPVIQSHLQLHYVILKLQDKGSFSTVPVVMKFFLTLARVREGAELLVNHGFLSSLRFLFTEYMDGRPFSVSSDKLERPQQIWGLALAVITAMVQSLGGSPSCRDILDNVIPYLFSEKGYIISYYLSAPDFPSDDHDKKRPRTQRTEISLTALKETEHTIMLMCVLARHWNSWVKAIKEMDSQLREQSIHLLAFISRGSQRLGDSSNVTAPLLCPPVLKEEFDNCNKPSFINSKNGWFSLSPLGCVSRPKFSAVSTTSTSLIIRSQPTESANHVSQTYFTDVVSLQIYRISFLLLKFLCLQVEGAARRAEEVGYVDLAHFPELPMPDILHGLQDQAISIVAELCEANTLSQIKKEIQNACCLLLQIMEMALYLELCLLQICGMRPVLGRVEDFSKEVKKLIRATEGHAFLKSSVKSLKQIISFVYPGLLQTVELM